MRNMCPARVDEGAGGAMRSRRRPEDAIQGNSGYRKNRASFDTVGCSDKWFFHLRKIKDLLGKCSDTCLGIAINAAKLLPIARKPALIALSRNSGLAAVYRSKGSPASQPYGLLESLNAPVQ